MAQFAKQSTRNGSAREAASSNTLMCCTGAEMNWKLVYISLTIRTSRNRKKNVLATARFPFPSWARSQNPSNGWVITWKAKENDALYRSHQAFLASFL